MVKTKVKCPYAEDCCDVDSEKCLSCLNNKKRSYYQPKQEWFWYRPHPTTTDPYPYVWPYTICDGTTTYDPAFVTTSTTESRYIAAGN